MAKDLRYMFFDTEMDGYDHLVSIGFVITNSLGEIIDKGYYIIKPSRPFRKSSVAIHGITTQKARKEGISLLKAIRKFDNLANTCDIISGYAICNDLTAMSFAYSSLGKVPSMLKQYLTVIDIVPMASEYMHSLDKGVLGNAPHLSVLHQELFDGEQFNAHNALDDAIAAARCFWRLTAIRPFVFKSIIPYKRLLKYFKDIKI